MHRIFQTYLLILKWFIVLCLAGMVVLVFGNVVLRYVFNSGLTVSEEFSRWLFVWMVFIGSIVVLHENGHLGLDFIVNSLPRPLRRVSLALAHILMLYATWLVVVGSWAQVSVNTRTYAPASGLPLSMFFGVGLVFGISTGGILLWRLWLVMTGRLDRLHIEDEETAALRQAGVK
ncbi:C4-dicarboxylate ABC transporter permease [Paracoccus acridae]|uniref:TRAP transporter small permease protein n=1 Tax=Paracoccus acridae TaxID=1795310 RepID=A0ABQ1VKT1_9RHOB|nr:TRAP transporter small permease [Paracoccus acridae]GGF76476.1 C4-dicarboxylate ABC transporter permease [Paracoccus acridae]